MTEEAVNILNCHMKKISLMSLGMIAICLNVNGQSSRVKLLESTIKAINNHHVLYYRVKSIQKNPFSENDKTINKSIEIVNLNGAGNIVAQNILLNINNHQTDLREVFSHDTLYNIDLRDSVYSIDQHPKGLYNSLNSFSENIRHAIKKASSKIALRQDTTIDHIRCYSFFINSFDTIVNNNHNFTYQFFYINKKTLLPIYTKELGAGSAEKGGYSLGRLSFFSETYFYGYEFNRKPSSRTFYFDKSGFDIKNENMLANGTIAPEIMVRNLSEKAIPVSEFKNKIILLEFGSTTCGANPLANPMLNRLGKKYNSPDIAVISIYSEETPDQVKNYIKANHIQFPIYLSDNIKANGQRVKGLDKILASIGKGVSREQILVWLIKDTKVMQNLLFTGDRFYYQYGGNDMEIKPRINYIQWQFRKSGVFANYVVAEKATDIVNPFHINYTHPVFVTNDVKISDIEKALITIGAKQNFEELPVPIVFGILKRLEQQDVERTGKNSATVYKLAIKNFSEPKNSVLATKHPKVKLFAKRGQERNYLPANEIYYADNHTLPAKVIDRNSA
jgi:thiol-disulfide isomerase/thioredoxin